MAYFIGIVPPQNHKLKILNFQRKWPSNKLPDYLEPHVTLKSPKGLNSKKLWLHDAAQIASEFKPFMVTVKGLGFFGDNVLVLKVFSPVAATIHKALVSSISQTLGLKGYRIKDENRMFKPHITIAKISAGNSSEELREMYDLAKYTLTLFSKFEARFLRIFERNPGQDSYHKFMDLPLGKPWKFEIS